MKYKITYDEAWKDVEYVEAKSVYTGQGGTVEFIDDENYTVLILGPMSYAKVEMINEPIVHDPVDMGPLPERDEIRPSTEELLGIDPDWLGGRSVDDYIREVRGD